MPPTIRLCNVPVLFGKTVITLDDWLESVPSIAAHCGQDVSPPNPFHTMHVDSKNSLGHGLQPARASSP